MKSTKVRLCDSSQTVYRQYWTEQSEHFRRHLNGGILALATENHQALLSPALLSPPCPALLSPALLSPAQPSPALLKKATRC